MTNIEARLSPAIKALDPLDRMDVFRLVVERADFESGDNRLCELEVGDRRVCWKIVGSLIAIGLADEFSSPRNSDDASPTENESGPYGASSSAEFRQRVR